MRAFKGTLSLLLALTLAFGGAVASYAATTHTVRTAAVSGGSVRLRAGTAGVWSSTLTNVSVGATVQFMAEPDPGFIVGEIAGSVRFTNALGGTANIATAGIRTPAPNIFEFTMPATATGGGTAAEQQVQIMPGTDVVVSLSFVPERHPIRVDQLNGGSVRMGQTTARPGDAVIFEVRPDDGLVTAMGFPYLVNPNAALGVGAPVPLSPRPAFIGHFAGWDRFEFTMPAHSVIIRCAFVSAAGHRVFELRPVHLNNGTATFDRTWAREGDTVVVTVQPHTGFRMLPDSFRLINPASPSTIFEYQVVRAPANAHRFEFTMPSNVLTASVTFVHTQDLPPDTQDLWQRAFGGAPSGGSRPWRNYTGAHSGALPTYW
ncbi:MAG: hypothetical protein FWE32_01775 [Oscillospiraceae bacterium]|nr:hypothetical protein [Oscillospiraceae bacterium]